MHGQQEKTDYVKPGAILVMDLVISVVASLAAILLNRYLTAPIFGFSSYVAIWVSLAALGSLTGFLIVGSYKVIIRFSTLKDILNLEKAVLIKEVLLLICVLTNLFHIKNMQGGLLVVVLDASISFFMFVMVRIFLVSVLRTRNVSMEESVSKLDVLVFGADIKASSLVTRLAFSSSYNVQGIIVSDKSLRGQIIYDKKIYSCDTEQDFINLCTMLGGIDCVVFARKEDAESQEKTLIPWCVSNGVHVLMAPRVEEVQYGGISRKAAKDISTDMDYIPDGMSSFERNTKRILDFLLSSLLIVVFSPLMLICYIAIKREDHGPALYRQERIGRFGRPFYILKFRSMRLDAEKAGPALYAGDDDPRLTRVGKYLRQHHLDELPQLFNVFKGDMAFVGHRPERQYYIDQIMAVDPRYYYLYQIRPGVTSYATLHNGYTDTLEKMVRRLQFDLYYLRHRSWWFDIKVLWLTFVNIAFGKKF